MPALYLKLDNPEKISFTTYSRPFAKIIIVSQGRVDELLGIDKFEDVNKILFRDYGFLFTKQIMEMKESVNQIIDDNRDMPDINGSECMIDD